MKPCNFRRGIAALVAVLSAVTATHDCLAEQKNAVGIDTAQIPKWSSDDLNFFLHGSMSTEVVPEPVFRAFIQISLCLPRPPESSAHPKSDPRPPDFPPPTPRYRAFARR